jgi:ERF superfamily
MSAEPAKNLPTVVQALAAVMQEESVQAIAKGRRNKDQGFKYRGIDEVMNAVGPAFRKHGVVCVPVEAGYDAEHYTTKKQTAMKNVTVRVAFRFFGPAGDYIDAMTLGEAADSGDKAVSKAHSVAFRTLLLEALCIPTGDEDPDATAHERADRRVDTAGRATVPKSWAELEQLVKGCDNPEEAWALFQAFVRAGSVNLYGKSESSELDQGQKDIVWQKALGAAVWLAENVEHEGPFRFYDEPKQRTAWQHVLNTKDPLPIPDYEPPEPPLDEKAQAEAEQLAEEVFADGAGDYTAEYDTAGDGTPETAKELAAEDQTPQVPQD